MVLVITQKVLLHGEKINILLMLKGELYYNLIGGLFMMKDLIVISESGMRSWFRDLFTEHLPLKTRWL
jgi:hypothetical protein